MQVWVISLGHSAERRDFVDTQLEANFAVALEAAREVIHDFGFLRLQEEWKRRKSLVARRGSFGVYFYPSFPLGAQACAISPAVSLSHLSTSTTISGRAKGRGNFWLKARRFVSKSKLIARRASFNALYQRRQTPTG